MRRYEQLPNANLQDYYGTLKQLVKRRDALARTKSMLMRQFHDQIQYSYPSYKKFFHEIECNTSLTFYKAYPSAEKGKNVQNKNQGNRELYAVLYLLAMQQVQMNTKGEARNPIMRAYFECKVKKVKQVHKRRLKSKENVVK